MPVETNARKWTSLIWKLFTLTALAIMACGAMGVALIANNHAGHVGTCVNDVLGSRNGPASNDNQALIRYLQADKQYTAKLNEVFAAPRSQQEALFEQFKRTSLSKQRVDQAALAVIIRDRNLRNAQPLGAC